MMLAGDVGATKTNLAMFTVADGNLEIAVEETFLNHEHATLEQITAQFIARHGCKPAAACFGVAGPVAGGRTHMPNTGWEIDARRIGGALGVDRVVLLNDLEATAYGVSTLDDDDFGVLNEGKPQTAANLAIIAAGTGLGEAILFWDGARYRVSASEGGHADFGPRGEEQTRIFTRLAERFGHVSYERVVSGPGLHNVYEALDMSESSAMAERIASADDPSAVIAQAALSATSARCARALDVFVACYGAEAGNLALKALATGGVYVGGGIAPKIVGKLEDGTFMGAFCNKGRFAELLRGIPVKVILDPTTALRGAAEYLANVRIEDSGVAGATTPRETLR